MENQNFEKESLRYLAIQDRKFKLKTSEIVTIEEASQILRIDKHKVIDLIKYGVLKAVNSTKGVKISRKSISEFADQLFHIDFPNNFNDLRITNIFKPLN